MLHASAEYIIKSILVTVLLIILIVLAIRVVLRCIQKANQGEKWYGQGFLCVFSCLVSLLAVITLHDYLNPAERRLEPELITTITISQEEHPDGVWGEGWHAVYGKYGSYPGTWVHPHEYYQSRSDAQWPEFDLENYTYIITYGQKIESLSYNVWDASRGPTYTGAKYGHMVLAEEVAPWEIYIYRIPKMRINNPEI